MSAIQFSFEAAHLTQPCLRITASIIQKKGENILQNLKLKEQHKCSYVFWVLLFGFILLAANAFSAVIGDIDGSGEVDLPDALLALQVCAGLNPSGIDKTADVNHDSKICIEEAVYVLKFLSESKTKNTGELGIPKDYDETILSFRDTFPDTAGSFDNFISQLPSSFDWRDHGVVTRAKSNTRE